MADAEILEIRAAYSENLEYVIETILEANIYLIMAGPELLGEGNFLKPRRFWWKASMLDDYREINMSMFVIHYFVCSQTFHL